MCTCGYSYLLASIFLSILPLDSCEPRKSLNPSRTLAASMTISSHCNCHIRITNACFGSFYACVDIACACSKRYLAHAEICGIPEFLFYSYIFIRSNITLCFEGGYCTATVVSYITGGWPCKQL